MQELPLSQMLKQTGYVCGWVGKWHLGGASNLRPTQRGFDEYFGFLQGASPYFDAQLLRNETPVVEHGYLTDAFTREAVSFINRHAPKPFFLGLAYNAPHDPYDTPPQSYMDRVANITDPDRRIYAAMITALDDGIGQVLQALQAQNLLNNTLIFFLSDNGAPQATFTRNYPLRGYKGSTYEGGIRVPFAVQWIGRLPTGIAYDQPVSALDIVPTVAAATGISLPTDRVYDGLNVQPYLSRQQLAPPRTLFWRWFGLGATGPPGSRPTIYAVRSDSLKLVNTGGSQLFNLASDIGESYDLAQSRPGDLASLSQLYAQWNAQMIEPLWQGLAQISPFAKLVLAGDWNAFNKDDTSPPWSLTKIIAPGAQGTPDGFDWFIDTIHVATTGGDTAPGVHSFSIVGDGNYSNQWGGATINSNGTTSVPYFSGNTLGPTNSITLEDGFYYSFRILAWRFNNPLNIGVMKTSAPPISVNVTGQTPTAPTSDDSAVVSIITSQPKSSEERIYLRWSTDTFITSHMVEAAGFGVNYSAAIPAQPAGTSVQYCITTSTVDLSQLVTSRSIDFFTLATSSNTHFVVAPGAMPTPTPSPTSTPTVQATVQTTVAGLTFTVDGTSYSSTQTFSWPSGSTHTIATTSLQNGATGVRYIWTRWSDNGAISHTVAPTTNKTYTATFSTQYYLTTTHGTGGTVGPGSGWRNSGSNASITATPTNNTQVSYYFDQWIGTGTGSYSGTNNPASMTMNGPITETAVFIQNPVQVTVQTNPTGRSFTVDGNPYTAARTFSWQPGSSHTVASTSPQSGGTGVRYVWNSWTGGGAISHTVAPTTNKTYTATFGTQYYLTMSHGAGGTVSPTSGWRNRGVAVSITATPASGYSFSNWTGTGTGSFSGATNTASITMGSPNTEMATFIHN